MVRHRVEAFLRGESCGLWARLLRVPLIPPSLLFGGAALLRRAAFERGVIRRSRLPVPVISVGNLVLGGTGKTPFVRMLCRRLLERAEQPVVLSRGHGARVAGQGLDEEACTLTRDLPGVRVAHGRDRWAAFRSLDGGDPAATVAVLDDGAQALGVDRDLEIILIDSRRPFGTGWTLPAGDLREFPSRLHIADLVVMTRADEAGRTQCDETRAAIRRLAPGATILTGRHAPRLLPPGPEDLSLFRGLRAFLVSAIANPHSFRRSVERLGAIVVGVRSFPDHHAFLPGEWTAAAGVARAAGADLLLATGKDEPKLSCLPPPGIACRFLEVEMELDPGSRDVLDAALDPILGGTRVGM